MFLFPTNLWIRQDDQGKAPPAALGDQGAQAEQSQPHSGQAE